MTAPIYKDRVKETSTTTGTGTLTLAGAISGFQAFSAVGNGNLCVYCIEHQSANEWEVGIGTYTSAGTTLSRATVLDSSNSGSLVTLSAGTKHVFVVFPAARITKAQKPRLLMLPQDYEPPSAAYATLDLRNGHPVLDFDPTVNEDAIWTRNLSDNYNGDGLTLDTYWTFTSAVAGTLGIQASIERMDAASLDIDADSFATFQTATGAVPGTSGQILKVSITFASGSAMDNLVAGEMFRLKLQRDAVGTDTAAGDAELLCAVLKEQ